MSARLEERWHIHPLTIVGFPGNDPYREHPAWGDDRFLKAAHGFQQARQSAMKTSRPKLAGFLSIAVEIRIDQLERNVLLLKLVDGRESWRRR